MNLDDFDPDYPEVPKKLKKHEQVYYYYVRRQPERGKSAWVGIHPVRMLNWRSLERRRHELWVSYKQASKQFWTFMEVVGRAMDKDEEKWVMFTKSLVCRFYERGYSLESSERLLEDLLTNKKYYDPYILVKPEEGGTMAHRLKMRADRLVKAWRFYDEAFKQAVRDRLRKYVDATWSDRDGFSYPAKVFLVKNEGRTSVVTMDHRGSFSFQDGEVEECI